MVCPLGNKVCESSHLSGGILRKDSMFSASIGSTGLRYRARRRKALRAIEQPIWICSSLSSKFFASAHGANRSTYVLHRSANSMIRLTALPNSLCSYSAAIIDASPCIIGNNLTKFMSKVRLIALSVWLFGLIWLPLVTVYLAFSSWSGSHRSINSLASFPLKRLVINPAQRLAMLMYLPTKSEFTRATKSSRLKSRSSIVPLSLAA